MTSPAREAFDLWLTTHYEEVSPEAAEIFWECFLAGFEVGKIEGADDAQ